MPVKQVDDELCGYIGGLTVAQSVVYFFIIGQLLFALVATGKDSVELTSDGIDRKGVGHQLTYHFTVGYQVDK